jgi:CDGSH-type Zn-finger protein
MPEDEFDSMAEKKPVITVLKDGPLKVENLKNFKNSKNVDIQAKPFMALCRCGASNDKPFCDGAHLKIGFTGAKSPDRVKSEVDEYKGKNITITMNDSICAHNGACINNLPEVFLKEEPWVNPDGADVRKIMELIDSCPSGALSYKIGDKCYTGGEREPAIKIVKDGPLAIVGGIELVDGEGSKPECIEHYTLCRCGVSKNKPFCDGSHHDIEFKDEKN